MEQGNIRALAKVDGFALSLAVTAELEFSIRTYSGLTDFDDAQIAEFTQLVLSEFAHLGVGEIREAFRLVAIGTVKNAEKVIDLRAYRDVFTGAVLGDVLRCYDDFRKAEIVKALQVEQARLEREESERHTREEEELKRQRNERAIDIRIEQLREMKGPNLTRVRERDYELLDRRGLLVALTREKRFEIYERAKAQYLIELKNDLWSEKKEIRLAANTTIALIEKGEETEELKEKYQETARRLAVVEWIEKQRVAVPVSGDGKLAV